jgi:hypothetical protein
MLIRLLILVILGFLVFRVAKAWFGSSGRQGRVSGPQSLRPVDDEMVKDPQCGAYFPLSKGYGLTFQGEDLYFCSSDCRQRYLEKHG